MARLIVKSPYIQCGKQNAGGYLRYIATRERVEIIPDDRPPTRKQEQLITKLTKDFPDVKELLEYDDYVQKPTKANASSLITLALEEHWKQVQQTDGYMKYIATRPRAERLGDHGLFGDADHVDLDAAMSELEHYTGNVWTHIISLHREDAERLGYNNAQAWRALIRAHRNDIAAAMHIPPQDFRWYAAFHDEGHHPHVHMMAWSVKPGQAHLDQNGIRQMKSRLTNDIFQQEYLMGKSVQKNAVKAEEYLRHAADNNHPWASYLLGKLYLTGNGVPKDEEAAWNCFRMADAYGHPYARYVLERQDQWHKPQLLMTVSRLLYHMSNIFRDNAPTVPAQPRLHIDRKRMQELQELRIALGHQPDDHEEEQTQTQTWSGMTMKGW